MNPPRVETRVLAASHSPKSAQSLTDDGCARPADTGRQHDLPLNPFLGAFSRDSGVHAASATEPAEGGILMLHDLQESEASRAALVSAWRDYGPQVQAPPGTWLAIVQTCPHESVLVLASGSWPSRVAPSPPRRNSRAADVYYGLF